LQPLSAVVFLSWSADLLRSTLEAAPVDDVATRLGMVALLGACGFAAGAFVLDRVLARVRETGDLAHT
ncbi:MAG: ABC transporter permease, partial [Actinomycetota bacterium]|nr:ABC transporter permease [Actinomycetota bacterium]